MKRFLITVLCLLIVIIPTLGCKSTEPSLYTATFYDVFDTVTVLRGYASDKSEFDQVADHIHTLLLEYHSLYDIYHDPEKGNNLKTINDNAGSEPVPVDSRIIDLLLFCKETDIFTDHKVNAMLGPVLSLWHDARTMALDDPAKACLPRPVRESPQRLAQQRTANETFRIFVGGLRNVLRKSAERQKSAEMFPLFRINFRKNLSNLNLKSEQGS